MGKKKVHHEEHPDETWLIPYADMLTLLLALFIVMFAMSELSKQKMENLSRAFSVAFSGGSGVMKEEGKLPKSNTGTKSVIINNSKQTEADKMIKIREALNKEIDKKGYKDKVKVLLNSEGLEISIQDVILFGSGDANIFQDINPLLLNISNLLKVFDNDIKIIGHTDNVPIQNAQYRSNWELSAIRAVNVMNFMVSQGKLAQKRFSIEAYGEFKPKFSNATAEGRAGNRRVEIFIKRTFK